MRIGIDARFYGSVGKGLGRYTRQLIHHLENKDGKNEYIIFLRKENFNEYVPRKENFKKFLADVPWYGWKEQWKIPLLFKKHKVDLAHFPHFNVPLFYRGRFVITIHDLILLHYPTVRATRLNPAYYWIKFFFYQMVLKHAIFSAARILTVSRFTKNDILKNYTVQSHKIVVTREASSFLKEENYEKNTISEGVDKLVLKKYGIISPYILYVGNAYPHKNLERLVCAFKRASLKEVQLVLVGKMDFFYKRLRDYSVSCSIDGLIFTDFLPDRELEILYGNATMYIFPSLYEGFGLPPLEAMAHNVPVASSNRTAMPEILGKAAFYFDPEDEMDICRAMTNVMNDVSLRKDLKKRGRKRALAYDWDQMANATLGVYNRSFFGGVSKMIGNWSIYGYTKKKKSRLNRPSRFTRNIETK